MLECESFFKINIMKISLRFLTTTVVCCLISSLFAQEFKHPGILHTKESLDYVKQKAITEKANPWLRSYNAFRTSGWASKMYTMLGPTKKVTRDQSIINADGINYKNIIEQDSYAIYCQALMWKLTGDASYAEKAINMLNAWSSTVEEIVGADIELTVSFNGFVMCCGAELMLDYENWKAQDIQKCKNMFRNIWYPHIQTIERVNGQGTWDSANMKAVLAFSIFLEDRDMFNSVLDYFYTGNGNGTINHYFIDFAKLPEYADAYGHLAETQECGRKQGYAQLGMANFEEVCEIAYNQGHPELWTANERVIMKAFEYIACYNLGNDVPYVRFEGRYPGTSFNYISSDGRGDFKPIYHMAYNHFHNRLGLEMSYTKQVIEEKIPYETTHATVTDGIGWGTLFFYNTDQTTGLTNPDRESGVSVFSKNGQLYIEGLEPGTRLSLYSLSGKLLSQKYAEGSTDKLNAGKGCCILKITGLNRQDAVKVFSR